MRGALCRRADLVHKGELGREDRYRDYFEDALPSPLHAKNENPPTPPKAFRDARVKPADRDGGSRRRLKLHIGYSLSALEGVI